MTIHSVWLEPTGQTRLDTRLATSVAMAPTGVLTSRSGVVPDGGFGVQQVSAMQCQIMPGRAFVQGAPAQGGYQVASDAPVVLTVANGDPANSRIDIVALQIQDADFGASQSQAAVVLIPGTPAAAPLPPPVPSATLALFQITVPAAASAGTGGIAWSTAVTDVRTYTAELGGIVPSGTTPWTPPMAGQYADLNGELQRWTGAAWTPVYDPMTSGGTLPQVTTTTRPANAPAGKLVYETDSSALALYNGTSWQHRPGLIGCQVLGATTASVTFSAIPQVYRDLRLVICARSSGTTTAGYDQAYLRLNGDTGTHYNWNSYWATESATSLAIASTTGVTSAQIAEIWNSYYSTQGRGIAAIDIPNYTDTNNVKVFMGTSAASDGGAVGILQTYGGGWHDETNAITSITVYMGVGSFLAGSTFALYGLA